MSRVSCWIVRGYDDRNPQCGNAGFEDVGETSHIGRVLRVLKPVFVEGFGPFI